MLILLTVAAAATIIADPAVLARADDFADAEAEMDGTNTTSRATVYLPTGTQVVWDNGASWDGLAQRKDPTK